MELPKNLTQIGESNPHCKIYVEDYVFSYLKQLNPLARDKGMAVALYGVKKEEAGISYLFLYGGCGLHFLQKESRHLSQAVMQEVEKQRKLYFSAYEFLAYCMLDGEVPEGFHVYEQGICRYITGYARFYEKNDSMLAFMVSGRREEAQPEVVEQEKYEEVRKRQEERRALAEHKGGHAEGMGRETNIRSIYRQPSAATGSLRGMRWSVAAVFAMLCVVGLYTLGEGENKGDLQAAARQLFDSVTEQQIPDMLEAASGATQAGTIVAEDNLTDAILKENEDLGTAAVSGSDVINQGTPLASAAPSTEPGQSESQSPAPTAAPAPVPAAEPTPVPTPAPTAEPTPAPTVAPVSYTVKTGDTLLGICLEKYGSDSRMADICRLNEIDDPDRIKVGQKILLP